MSLKGKIQGQFSQWGRLQTIVRVMASHGFTGIIQELGYSTPVAGLGKRQPEEGAIPRHLRLAFEELGPTFIKLGQLLSTRPDIFPDQYIEEFSKLTDQTPPFAFETVMKILEEEFGRSPYEIFSEIESTPLAAASIAQVHRAKMIGSEEDVVIKVQRPGIAKTIQNDIQVLFFIARGLERVREEFRWLSLTTIVQEFQRNINDELDFYQEARNIDEFNQTFGHIEGIVLPVVSWDHTTKRVITMSEIKGTPFSKLKAFPENVDRSYLLEQLVQLFFEGMLFHGIFHADIHAGNILLISEGRGKLGVLDFGLVGTLREDIKVKISKLFIAFINRDYQSLALIYSELGDFMGGLDLKEFQRDIATFLEPNLRGSLSDVDTGQMLLDSTKIARKHHIRLPRELILFFRSLITLEGIGRKLDPNFEFLKFGAQFSKTVIRKRFSPEAIFKDVVRTVDGFRTLGVELPTFVRVLTRQMERNASEKNFERLEKSVHGVRKSLRQLSFAIICLGFLLGASILASNSPDHVMQWPLWIASIVAGSIWLLGNLRG